MLNARMRPDLCSNRFKRLPPLHWYMMMGNGPGWANARDPLAVGLDEELGCDIYLHCMCHVYLFVMGSRIIVDVCLLQQQAR